MPIVHICSACGRHFHVDRRLIGKLARCSECRSVQRIADLPEISADPATYPLASTFVPTPLRPTHSIDATTVDAKPVRRSEPTGLRWFREAALDPSRLEGPASLLVALSAADLFMTFTLLRSHPHAYESNPVASWFFHRWNMAGMTLFKFGVIGGVIALAELVERRRPGWGRFVVLIGCVGALYALGTGLGIYLGVGAEPPIASD